MGSIKERREVYDLVNKSRWIQGVWNKEPDFIKFIYREDLILLRCIIRRDKTAGNLVCYIGVPEGNVYYEKDTNEAYIPKFMDFSFTGFAKHYDKEFKGEKKHWYLGFDLGRDDDLSPGLQIFDASTEEVGAKVAEILERVKKEVGEMPKKTYKDVKFAEKLLVELAQQIIKDQKAFIVAKARKGK